MGRDGGRLRHDVIERNYLLIGREVFRKHPCQWTDEEWEQAADFVALALLEQRELEEEREAGG